MIEMPEIVGGPTFGYCEVEDVRRVVAEAKARIAELEAQLASEVRTHSRLMAEAQDEAAAMMAERNEYAAETLAFQDQRIKLLESLEQLGGIPDLLKYGSPAFSQVSPGVFVVSEEDFFPYWERVNENWTKLREAFLASQTQLLEMTERLRVVEANSKKLTDEPVNWSEMDGPAKVAYAAYQGYFSAEGAWQEMEQALEDRPVKASQDTRLKEAFISLLGLVTSIGEACRDLDLEGMSEAFQEATVVIQDGGQ